MLDKEGEDGRVLRAELPGDHHAVVLITVCC